jgi:hypothetical protein
MVERRDFLFGLGVSGGAVAFGGLASDATAGTVLGQSGQSADAERLYAEIIDFPYDDTHCHPLTDADAQTTPARFLERLSLAAFPAPAYFPRGVYRRWREGDAATKAALDREYGIQGVLDEINYHFGESVFVKYIVKEMADFLDCAPTLEEVIEARNERGKDYWKYVNDLFRDVNAANLMIDTGYSEGMGAEGIARFESAVAPAESRRIYRVETIQRELFAEDIEFEELESRFVNKLRLGLDGDGNYGAKSYGKKSYLMPRIGVVKPLYDAGATKRSWDDFRTNRQREYEDREERAHRTEDLERYLLTLALEACLERDMPMQFHAGDGEAPGIILRQQDPYNLEEVVRFDRDGVMRMPKIIPVHAGYPLVGKAAWLSHLYTNCYFELSIMTPLIHQGLFNRYLQVMEAVPLSKILFSSDAYHVPELYWLTGRWGKRYLSRALGEYVREGSLNEGEVLEAARMILHRNNRRVYNLVEMPRGRRS